MRDPVSCRIVKHSHDIASWPSLEHSQRSTSTHTLNLYQVPVVDLAFGDRKGNKGIGAFTGHGIRVGSIEETCKSQELED